MGGVTIIKLNNKGITLVEVLAVIVIASIFITIILSVLSSSSSTHIKQNTNTRQLYDLSYSFKIITKDVRKSKNFEQLNSDFIFTPSAADYFTEIIYKFDVTTNTIFRDTVPIAKDIACFYISSGEGDPSTCKPNNAISPTSLTKINVYIQSLNGNVVETELFLRKGDD